MKTLFLDLASHDALIACCNDSSVFASESVHARIGDHEVIPMIEKVLEGAKWKFEDLERIACIIGPGGFTSLRVAVTFANVFADQLKIPSAGVHLSDLYRARTEDTDAHWVHSTKKDQLFIRGGQWEEATLIDIDELAVLGSRFSGLSWTGELIDEHREIIKSEPIELKAIDEVLPRLLKTQEYTSDILTPWYGRGW